MNHSHQPSVSEVHIWLGPLSSSERLDTDLVLLSVDERTRADQFHFDRDRARFVRCRAALRRVLGNYLAMRPERVTFQYGEYGKPELSHEVAHRDGLAFNASHSGDWAAIAVTGAPSVGIDIEQTRPLADLDNMAKTCFSTCERAEYYALSAAHRREAFYCGWTRKEALLKALGSGLYYPLADFDVTLHPAEPPRLLRIAGSPTAAERWQLHSFQPTEDYTVAVAVERVGDAVLSFEFHALPES